MNQLNTWYRMQPPAIRALLTINVVIYVLWFLLFQHFDAMETLFNRHLALQAEPTTFLYQPWQLITYNFLHLGTDLGGILHITFNMLWLVWIGRDYEELHGSHRLLAVYIIAGIGGGILSIVIEGLFPGFAGGGGDAAVVVHGASASVLGVMMTMAILHPYKSIGLLFLGTVRLLYVVLGFLVIDALFMQGTAVAAHWGGVLFGFLFAKAESSGVDLSSWATYFFKGGARKSSAGSSSSSGDREGGMLRKIENWLASKNDSAEPPPKKQPTRERTWRRTEVDVEVIETSKEDEVDRILDKISAEGYEALTPAEKKILYEASRK
ncbi:MAG: rhomboid family intramembrane serine protease [Bacteroidota bacterium]